jgi:hypothetical protein
MTAEQLSSTVFVFVKMERYISSLCFQVNILKHRDPGIQEGHNPESSC